MKFLTGVNQAWFNGAYGNDIGLNQMLGSELWTWPHDAPVDVALARVPHITKLPLMANDATVIDMIFSKLRGIDVVRVWLHEQLEGIKFDSDLRVVGLDEDVLLPNLKKVLDCAQRHGIKIYLCLFDAWTTKNEPSKTLPPNRLPFYQAWRQAKVEAMRKIIVKPGNYLQALEHTLFSVARHPALFAIDVMNEPEGVFPIHQHSITTEAQTVEFLKRVTDAIRIGANIDASIGWMRRENAVKYASKIRTDFCDFHYYMTSASSLPSYQKSDFAGKPCIIGEFGYPHSQTQQARRLNDLTVGKELLRQAWSKGYIGALSWHPTEFVNPDDGAQMLEFLKTFAKTDKQVQPPKVLSAWEHFLKLFGAPV